MTGALPEMGPSEERVWRRAERYLAEQQLTAARIAFESLLQRVPEHVPARVMLAGVILAEGRVREAAEHVLAATRVLPSDGNVIATVAQCLLRIGEMVAARDCLAHPEVMRTQSGSALATLAHVHQAMGDHVASLALMDRALAAGFDNPDFRYFRALQLQFNGRIDDARAELETCLRMGPTYGRASLTLARLGKQGSGERIDYIRAHLRSVERGSEDHAAFEFALYTELERLGETAQAFAALARGNAVMYGRLDHDIARESVLFDTLIERCTGNFLRPHEEPLEGPLPIFVIGLPRSGTTLLDRILGNHSEVISAGERSDFPRQLRWVADLNGHALIDGELLDRAERMDFAELGRRYLLQTQWRAPGKRYFVDKLPPNYMVAGLLQRALPRAPILHIVRPPMDVCFSNYKALFGDAYPHSYDLAALAAHYRDYRRLMRHWHAVLPGRILDVEYARLVADPEGVAREILAHCGLGYEAACIDVQSNSAPVATLSSAQVREPIHARSLGEWRRYEAELAPLAEALGGAAP
jgi:hypothetical protein